MKIGMALAKLTNFGTMMNQWGKTPERDMYREIARNLQNELKGEMQLRWEQIDRVREIAKMYGNDQITAFFAMWAIQAVLAETDKSEES